MRKPDNVAVEGFRLGQIANRAGEAHDPPERERRYREAAAQDRAMLMTFIAACFERGVYLAVSPHHGFSAAHTDADLEHVAHVFEAALHDVHRAHPGKGRSDGG